MYRVTGKMVPRASSAAACGTVRYIFYDCWQCSSHDKSCKHNLSALLSAICAQRQAPPSPCMNVVYSVSATRLKNIRLRMKGLLMHSFQLCFCLLHHYISELVQLLL